MRAAGRLFLRNLPFSTTEADLAELLGDYGQLSEVHLVMDRSVPSSCALSRKLHSHAVCGPGKPVLQSILFLVMSTSSMPQGSCTVAMHA